MLTLWVMARIAAASFLLGVGAARVLVDVGNEGGQMLPRLRSALAGADVTDVVLTHWHAGHAGAAEAVMAAFSRARLWKMPGKFLPKDVAFAALHDGQVLAVPGGGALKVIATPGHAADHAALFDVASRTLFSGDALLLPGASAVYEDAGAYAASLARMRRLEPRRIIPSHGAPIEGSDACAAVLDREMAFQHAITTTLIAQLPTHGSGITAAALADKVSGPLGFPLKTAAATVKVHLIALERAGRAVRTGASARPLSEDPATFKGPGGLTMLQIQSLVQQAGRRDAQMRSIARTGSGSQAHAGLESLDAVAWRRGAV